LERRCGWNKTDAGKTRNKLVCRSVDDREEEEEEEETKESINHVRIMAFRMSLHSRRFE
jgi:hypothetical protein